MLTQEWDGSASTEALAENLINLVHHRGGWAKEDLKLEASGRSISVRAPITSCLGGMTGGEILCVTAWKGRADMLGRQVWHLLKPEEVGEIVRFIHP